MSKSKQQPVFDQDMGNPPYVQLGMRGSVAARPAR